jgi:DNA-binding PadR family transcriptional regulator
VARSTSNLLRRATVYTPKAYTLGAYMDRFRPDTFLPLTAVAFEILLALAEGEQHGYSIMREVADRSGGAVTLHPGTLYRALARLLENGLIEELDERPDPANDDERRRYYRLTERGIAVARAEAERMASQLDAARSRKLLKVHG